MSRAMATARRSLQRLIVRRGRTAVQPFNEDSGQKAALRGVRSLARKLRFLGQELVYALGASARVALPAAL